MAAPLYQKVIDRIVEQISSGELLPGAMLPSEMQIAADTGVSQGTARKSLMELEKLGIVKREQGRGTFVTARTPDSALFNFFRLREPGGQLIRPELVSEKVIHRAASAREQAELDDHPSHVYEIQRLRSLKGIPSVIETAVISAQKFAGLDARAPLPNTLYVLYQQNYGCIILRADEQINAMAASAKVAEALQLKPGAPILCIDRLAYDILGRVVEIRRSLCRTEGLIYQVSLT